MLRSNRVMTYSGLYVKMPCGCRINETQVLEMCARHTKQIRKANADMAETVRKLNEFLASQDPTSEKQP